MTVTILQGDCISVMRTLPADSVDCVVTSPPYWGLRDYGVDGQMGLEHSLGEHLKVMVNVFEEIRRILKPSGTVWLNYGDCYASAPNGRSAADTKAAGTDDRTFRDKPFSTIGPIYDPEGGAKGGGARGNNKGNCNDTPKGRVVAGAYLKPKDLCMLPNRLAIALQEAGWWVRSEIIWGKPNPMPESIKDRPATSHEKIFLLTKSARYFYDDVSVRPPMAATSLERLAQNVEAQEGSDRANGGRKTNGKMKAVGHVDKQSGHGKRHAGFNERWAAQGGQPKGAKGNAKTFRGGGKYTSRQSFDNSEVVERDSHGNEPNTSGTRNLKNYEPAPVQVWEMATQPFSGAHFATMPPELAERCIKAGCPKGGMVFDPFGGAGTTGLVAAELGRSAILVELNAEYIEIARARIRAGLHRVECANPEKIDAGPLFQC